MQPSFFATAQFADIRVLLVGREKEKVQELGGTKAAPTSKREMLGNILYKFDHPHVFLHNQTLLRIIAKHYGIANIDLAAIGRLQSLYHVDKSGLAGAILSNNAQSFTLFESIVKALQDHFLTKALIHFFH